jgi:hypothetical protein
VGLAWPVYVKVANEQFIICDHLAVDGVEVLAAVKVLRDKGGGDVLGRTVKPHHHAVNRVREAGKTVTIHHEGGRGVHLLFGGHLQELCFVLANGPRHFLDSATNSCLRDARTKSRSSLKLAARIVIESDQHLLQHGQGPTPLGRIVELIIQQVHKS